MSETNESSGVQTVLLIFIIVMVVGAAVWVVARGLPVSEQGDQAPNVNITLPSGDVPGTGAGADTTE